MVNRENSFTRFYKIIFIFFVACIAFDGASFAAVQSESNSEDHAEVSNNYINLAKFYLPSLVNDEISEKKAEKAIRKHNKNLDKNDIKNIKIKPIGKTEKLRLLYDAFSSHEEKMHKILSTEQKEAKANKALVDEAVFRDLEFFCGNKPNFDHHLFRIIDKTQTSSGKICLQKMLYEPTGNIDELKRRQLIIKELLGDDKLCSVLDKNLSLINTAEDEFIWFFKELDEATGKFFETPYFQKGLMNGEPLNKSEGSLEALSLTRTVASPTLAIGGPLFGFLLGGWLSESEEETTSLSLKEKISSKTGALWENSKIFLQGTKKFFSSEDVPLKIKAVTVAVGALYAGLYGMGVSQSWSIAATNSMITHMIHTKVINVAKLIKGMEAVVSLIQGNEKIAALAPQWKKIQELFSKGEVLALVENLKSSTFEGEAKFFANRGKVLATFKQMQKVAADLVAPLKIAGEIDAYLSIAKLYKKHQNNPNARYCFVNYEVGNKPHLKLTGYWHPVLDPAKVVTNSFELGGLKKARNGIFTGPNAGGKSTSLKAITIAIILALTWGIGPADAMTLTPFALISTYLNIADSEGKESLFQAEMNRAQALLQAIQALRPGQLSYVIMDEIFTGTNPKEGMAGAYGIAKRLSSFKNSVNLIATHFHVLTDLEKDTDGLFENYKVTIYREDGLIKYPYKLEKGISNESIALELLQQAGFDKEILEAAQDILKNRSGQDSGFKRVDFSDEKHFVTAPAA